jgi:hypothetical protein
MPTRKGGDALPERRSWEAVRYVLREFLHSSRPIGWLRLRLGATVRLRLAETAGGAGP